MKVAPTSDFPQGTGSGPGIALCARELVGDLGMYAVDIDVLRRRVHHALDQQARPHIVDTIDAEGAADQWPVGLKKTQHAEHRRHRFSERRSHSFDLRLHSLYQLGSVSSADTERLDTRPNDATSHLQRGTLTHIPLRVDHPDPGRADHNVIDVRSGALDAAVVQRPEGVGQVRQTAREQLFADGAAFPRFRALWVIGEREDQPAELRMAGADSLFPVVSAALVFASRGCPRLASVRTSELCRAVNTAKAFRATLVDRFLGGGDLPAAEPARSGVPQPHPSFVWPQFR